MDILKMHNCFWENTGNIDIIYHCPYLVCKRIFHGSRNTFLPFDPIKCMREGRNGTPWTKELEANCELLKRNDNGKH